MKFRTPTFLLLAAFVAAPGTIALASEPVTGSGEPVTVRMKAEVEDDRRAAARSRTCLAATGSRIRRSGDDCRQPGRSYSRDDIDRTGSVDLADALQRLDPSISRGR